MMGRKQLRELSTRFRIAAHERHEDALIDIRAADVDAAADALSTPLWFSAFELRMVAETIDILHISSADAWTMRLRLDEFIKTNPPLNTAEAFANFVKTLPNGGAQ